MVRTTADGYVEVWDIESRRQFLRWQSHAGKSLYITNFTPEGWVAASANNVPDIHILKLDAARQALQELGLGW